MHDHKSSPSDKVEQYLHDNSLAARLKRMEERQERIDEFDAKYGPQRPRTAEEIDEFETKLHNAVRIGKWID